MATKALDPKEKMKREAVRKIEFAKSRIAKYKEAIQSETKTIETLKASIKK